MTAPEDKAAAAAAELRQAIREAHEAIKDLRSARRELRDARDILTAEINSGLAHLQAELNRVVDDQSAETRRAFEGAFALIQKHVDEVMDHMSRLLGHEDSEALMNDLLAKLTVQLRTWIKEDARH